MGPSLPVSALSTTSAYLALFWLLSHTLPCQSSKASATLACLALFKLFNQGNLFKLFNQGNVDTLDVN